MNPEQIVEALEELRSSLSAATTGGNPTMDNSRYLETRAFLKQHPTLAGNLPDWLRYGSSHADAVGRIVKEAGEASGKWYRRRELISTVIDQLVTLIEDSDAIAQATLERGTRLGGGGFGEVFKYRHTLLDMDFAVKLLSPSFSSGDEGRAIARFFKEGRILFRLSHPGIVRVFDVGVLKKRPFIRMEYIEGETLADAIRRGLPDADIRDIVRSLASALAHAHSQGAVHRDLKPSNVMIERATGRVVILDYGLGVFLEDEIASRLTRTGERAAAGHYTCPELLANPRLVDVRTDIYSLGAIWFEMLFGRVPAGPIVETQILERNGIRSGEASLLIRCLSDLEKRPSAEELMIALEGIS